MKKDSFNNPIDPVVGFARGEIIRSSIEEGYRLRNAQKIAAERVRKNGPNSIGIFTGNQRDFLINEEDISTLCEEWIGPGLVAENLKRLAVEHVGADFEKHEVAIFNRTSAAIIAVIASNTTGQPLVSIVPKGGRSHASVVRGAKLANVELFEIESNEDWQNTILKVQPSLVVLTTVTSSLERIEDKVIEKITSFVKAKNIKVFLDEAYGARLRPVLHGGKKSFEFNIDVAVTNCDKAGLPGPRAGILVGSKQIIAAAAAKGAEYGMEARAPILTGVMRSLEHYDPSHLLQESDAGKILTISLKKLFGENIIPSDLGPMIHEDEVLKLVLKRSGLSISDIQVVPCEVTAALGIILLKDYGILTVNTHGQPGARVSLRFKPSGSAIENVGGIESIVRAINESINKVAAMLKDINALRQLIIGE